VFDRLHGRLAKHGVDVAGQRVRPLRGVLGVLPAGLMGGDVTLDFVMMCYTAAERNNASGTECGEVGRAIESPGTANRRLLNGTPVTCQILGILGSMQEVQSWPIPEE
jgi:hypothetical protein